MKCYEDEVRKSASDVFDATVTMAVDAALSDVAESIQMAMDETGIATRNTEIGAFLRAVIEILASRHSEPELLLNGVNQCRS